MVNSICKSLGQSKTKKLFHCCAKLFKTINWTIYRDIFKKFMVNLVLPFSNKNINEIRHRKSKRRIYQSAKMRNMYITSF